MKDGGETQNRAGWRIVNSSCDRDVTMIERLKRVTSTVYLILCRLVMSKGAVNDTSTTILLATEVSCILGRALSY